MGEKKKNERSARFSFFSEQIYRITFIQYRRRIFLSNVFRSLVEVLPSNFQQKNVRSCPVKCKLNSKLDSEGKAGFERIILTCQRHLLTFRIVQLLAPAGYVLFVE